MAGKLAKDHILKAKQVDKARPGHSPFEERKWRIGSQGKQETKTEEGRRGFLHNKRDEVPQWRTLGTIRTQSPEPM
jgi:hypothetical protein